MELRIGDTGFVASAGSKPKWIVCPECIGTGRLRVILGDDSEVSIACVCCERGLEGSPGRIQSHEFSAEVQEVTIEGVESSISQPTRYHYRGCYVTEHVFPTKAEAEARAANLVIAQNAETDRRLRAKEKDEKSWAWNVSYHRRAIRDAQKQLDYHAAKLNVAPRKP